MVLLALIPHAYDFHNVSDVTRLLDAVERGEPQAAEELLPLVYEELRKLAAARMAQASAGQTLQATALVHEAWLRVQKSGPQEWNGRGHFFSAAAEAMRRILVEQARRKSRQRHGGALQRENLEEVDILSEAPEDKVILIHECLNQLTAEDPLKSEIVKLKFFAGLTSEEIANVLQISEKTVRRHWNVAKARLFQLIEAVQG
jgi:RNA polymerase sigma factor (TIGR02999 family)